MVRLEKMSDSAYEKYIQFAIVDFAEDKVRAGNWNEEEAHDLAAQTYERLLPNGHQTEKNDLYSIVVENEIVGMIWLHYSTSTEAFIYDFVVYDGHKGRGYGTEAMKLVEASAKMNGAHKMSLHVFGHNTGAKKLYDKLGFEVTNYSMSKQI